MPPLVEFSILRGARKKNDRGRPTEEEEDEVEEEKENFKKKKKKKGLKKEAHMRRQHQAPLYWQPHGRLHSRAQPSTPEARLRALRGRGVAGSAFDEAK